jgi:hypothetical protein
VGTVGTVRNMKAGQDMFGGHCGDDEGHVRGGTVQTGNTTRVAADNQPRHCQRPFRVRAVTSQAKLVISCPGADKTESWTTYRVMSSCPHDAGIVPETLVSPSLLQGLCIGRVSWVEYALWSLVSASVMCCCG